MEGTVVTDGGFFSTNGAVKALGLGLVMGGVGTAIGYGWGYATAEAEADVDLDEIYNTGRAIGMVAGAQMASGADPEVPLKMSIKEMKKLLKQYPTKVKGGKVEIDDDDENDTPAINEDDLNERFAAMEKRLGKMLGKQLTTELAAMNKAAQPKASAPASGS